ncbi:MAG: formylglycine-generating enzyme family protein [Verrucomicrobia bacterium]|nr:formylglycine-generating enzyme family protein [Verrucomicrobiota bacterium]
MLGWLLAFSASAAQGGDLTFDGIDFVQIPAGSFVMGTTDAQRSALEARQAWNQFDECERPPRRVRINRPFLMGKYEVTQKQWRDTMGDNPSVFQGDDRPVDSVSWEDVQRFLKKLNAKGNAKYRLPTEAEWEYCCRAGGTNLYGLGAAATPIRADNLQDYAWLQTDSSHHTHPVGGKRANAWGLHDMLGNVWEWCQDWYDAGFYAKAPIVDPVNSTPAVERVMRGGSWFLGTAQVRPGFRSGNPPVTRSQYIGFRLARDW